MDPLCGTNGAAWSVHAVFRPHLQEMLVSMAGQTSHECQGRALVSGLVKLILSSSGTADARCSAVCSEGGKAVARHHKCLGQRPAMGKCPKNESGVCATNNVRPQWSPPYRATMLFVAA